MINLNLTPDDTIEFIKEQQKQIDDLRQKLINTGI